ncbi:MAG: exodeoxyribonuclease VII large subunit [Alphaproteobacteria bacterium]|nr:exodeoxyribonuclease VII large subunit [Alphaproteobacteria bacterium]
MNPPAYDNEPPGPDTAGSNEPPVFSVTELSGALKRIVEDSFGYVRVRGEISGFKRAASGHLYMALKDADANMDAVCWRGTAGKLDIEPEDGLEVIATGRVTTYAARSKYQMVIERLEIAGEGALLKMIEERRKRLTAEGLFDDERKQALPYLPEIIGVVTSPTGAVFRDIMHRLNDRFPRRVMLWPVLVQGTNAAEQVTAAIEGFNALTADGDVPRPDLLIVARGGGSLEDLMAFNEENVVRAAAGSAIPLISAIGHETDTTLIDFAADRRAPTPTAAAELAVPVRAELLAQLADDGSRLFGAMTRQLSGFGQHVTGLARGLPEPRRILEVAMQRADDWSERLGPAMARMVADRRQDVGKAANQLVRPGDYVVRKRQDLAVVVQSDERFNRLGQAIFQTRAQYLANAAKLLESYSYKGVLERGFAVVRDSAGAPVTAADTLSPGDEISLSFKEEGRAAAVVSSVGAGTGAPPAPRKPAAKKKASAKKAIIE